MLLLLLFSYSELHYVLEWMMSYFLVIFILSLFTLFISTSLLLSLDPLLFLLLLLMLLMLLVLLVLVLTLFTLFTFGVVDLWVVFPDLLLFDLLFNLSPSIIQAVSLFILLLLLLLLAFCDYWLKNLVNDDYLHIDILLLLLLIKDSLLLLLSTFKRLWLPITRLLFAESPIILLL